MVREKLTPVLDQGPQTCGPHVAHNKVFFNTQCQSRMASNKLIAHCGHISERIMYILTEISQLHIQQTILFD